MSTFPVIDSTLSARHLSPWIAERYDLHHQITCRLFRTNMNHTYIVSAGEKKYILRIYSYNRRTKEEIGEEVRLLDLLKECGVVVSYPVADKRQGYVQEIDAPEGTRYAVLFSFGEGGKIRNLTEDLCYRIGLVMGEMHKATLNHTIRRTEYSAHTLAVTAWQQAKPYFSEALEEMKFVKASGKVLQSVLAQASASGIRHGVVHLDIWYDNMSITDEGRITLFDFDNCGNGPLVLDIGYFCMQLFHTQPDKGEYQQKLNSFLNGYREITPVPDREMALIPYAGLAVWIYYLGVQAERFDNFANIFFTENYLKMYIGKVREWLAYNDIKIDTTEID